MTLKRPLFVSITCATAYMALLSTLAIAQQPKTSANESAPPPDAASVAQGMQASFYHPDHLGGLDCAVAIDWPDFFKKMNLEAPEDRLTALQALQAHVHALRGKRAELTYKWPGEPPAGSDQITSGLQQMVGGFFQMYWPMIASFPISKAEDISKIDPQPGGGRKVSSISPHASVIVTVDEQNTPTAFSFDSPAMKGMFEIHYTPSPNPAPGDLRRISGFDADEQIGTSTLHLKVVLDYQKLDTWNVPHHVNLDVPGAYSIAFDLNNCSALPEGQ